jgi:hypothetical protein
MTWSRLSDEGNGLPVVMIIFAVESVVFLLAAWYIEQVFPGGVGVPRHPLFFLGKRFDKEQSTGRGGRSAMGKKARRCAWLKPWIWLRKRPRQSSTAPISATNEGTSRVRVEAVTDAAADVAVAVEPADVAAERSRVASITADRRRRLREATDDDRNVVGQEEAILMEELCKAFPNGKVAVCDLSLGVSKGECFGLLGEWVYYLYHHHHHHHHHIFQPLTYVWWGKLYVSTYFAMSV